MKRVLEVAEMLGVSKVTIYRKIETEKLQQYVTEHNKVRYIDDKGIELLRQKLCLPIEVTLEPENSNIETESTLHETAMLQLETEHLKRELEHKDMYINTLKAETEMLHQLLQHEKDTNKDLIRLIENSQVLLKQQQDKIFLLEQSDPAPDKKSFWERFFKS